MDKTFFKIKKFTTLPTEIKKQCQQLSKVCFPDDTPETADKFYNTDKFMTVIALAEKKVIGKLSLVKRTINYKGKAVILGGFGGVCVAPHKRRMGVASALVQVGMEELKKTNCDIAYLCTDIKDKNKIRLYQKVGFAALNKAHSFYGKSGRLYTEYDALLAPVNSPKIFNLVMSSCNTLHIGNGNW